MLWLLNALLTSNSKSATHVGGITSWIPGWYAHGTVVAVRWVTSPNAIGPCAGPVGTGSTNPGSASSAMTTLS